MKVFVVTDGKYDDVAVEGVFSSESLAREFARGLLPRRSRQSFEPPEITEWELDRPVDPNGDLALPTIYVTGEEKRK